MLDAKQNDIASASISSSAHALKLSANKQGGCKEISLGANRRAKPAALSHVVNNLWRLEATKSMPDDGSVIMEKCDTPYAEAEAAANHILALLRKGERCRDMLVLARSPENYRTRVFPVSLTPSLSVHCSTAKAEILKTMSSMSVRSSSNAPCVKHRH